MCKIHTNSEQASINSERKWNIVYSAKLACSLILNFDWSEKVYLSKFWPSNSAAREWSKVGHKDLILTTLLNASGRVWTKGKIRQRESQIPKNGHIQLKDVAM